MTVIGLTGGIASGKSTAAEYLRALGATLIDADRVGHRSYEPGTPGFEKVVNAFGHDIVGKDGTIDRRILGGKVFGAPGEMERLNSIVWPEIRRLISEELADLKRKDPHQIIVLEAAVLIEAGWKDLCDEIWVITVGVPTAVERLMGRNGLTEDAALARINAQMSSRDRAEHADVKIDNSGTEEQLRQRLDRAWKTLTKSLGDAQPRPPVKLPVRPAPRPAAPAKAVAAARPPAKAAAPASRPAAKAAPASKPAAKVASKSAAKPAGKAPSKPVAKPAAGKAVSRPASKPAAKAAGKSATKPATRPAAKPAAKASKPAAKASKAVRPAPKPAAKAAKSAKPAAKPVARAAAKPAGKAATKALPKAAARVSKPAARPAAKAPARTAAKPAAKAAPKARAAAKPAGGRRR